MVPRLALVWQFVCRFAGVRRAAETLVAASQPATKPKYQRPRDSPHSMAMNPAAAR